MTADSLLSCRCWCSNLALLSSSAAFAIWRSMPAHKRRTILNRVADLLEERKGFFSEVYGRETCVGGLVREVDWQCESKPALLGREGGGAAEEGGREGVKRSEG